LVATNVRSNLPPKLASEKILCRKKSHNRG
jgi:hypothetical protein